MATTWVEKGTYGAVNSFTNWAGDRYSDVGGALVSCSSNYCLFMTKKQSEYNTHQKTTKIYSATKKTGVYPNSLKPGTINYNVNYERVSGEANLSNITYPTTTTKTISSGGSFGGWSDIWEEYSTSDKEKRFATLIDTINIPLFDDTDSIGINKYIQTGEWTPPKPPINYGIHYHIAVEGSYRPNFYISWDSEGIDADPIIANNTTVSVAPFYGSFKGTSALFTVNYTKGVVMMSYDRLMQETNPVGWDQIITSLVEKFGGTETGATMKALRLDPDDPTKTISTSQCFFESNAHGEKGNCGLVFPDIDDGSTVDFISFNPEQYEDKDTDPDNPNGGDESDNIPNDISPLETSSTLTKSYVVTQSTLQNIGNQLWASGFIDNIKLVNNNPIENIISVKALAIPLTGTSEDIQIGNVSMGITGLKISNGYGKKVIGSCTVGEYYNSYLDYAPFTKITIFLPYVGYKELDVNQVMNKRLTISYAVDYITGAVKAIINNGVANIASFDGNCGVDIPITSSNRAQVEMGYVASAVGAVSSVATGDMTGAVMSGLSGVQNQFHSETKGQSSPNVACYEGTACYLIIERPVVNGSSRYANTYGLPLNCTKKLKDLNGFTVVDPSINLYGIGASDTEKEELRNIMSTGFFI